MEYERKKKMIEDVNRIETKEALCNIYELLESHNVEYNYNESGYFFTLNNLEEKVLNELEKNIQYHLDSEQVERERMKKMNKIKHEQKSRKVEKEPERKFHVNAEEFLRLQNLDLKKTTQLTNLQSNIIKKIKK